MASRHTSSRRPNFRPSIEVLEGRDVPSAALQSLSSSQSPYLLPTAPGVNITSIFTAGDEANGYKMVGIPDGLAAINNGNGTFTVLVTHGLPAADGVPRAHGATGSFVSQLTVANASLRVTTGDDLIQSLNLWNPVLGQYNLAFTPMDRLGSADLADISAFFDPATGRGTTSRILLNGEQPFDDNGRAFAHVASGPNAGTSWDLPALGRHSWANLVASPVAQAKTVVMALDNSDRFFSSEFSTNPSEVYVWVGNKQTTGTEIERAGLRNGILNGLKVGRPGAYRATEATIVNGDRFELVALFNQTNQLNPGPLQQDASAKGVTQFREVGDGAFDPTNPNVFYFSSAGTGFGPTRLWKLTFDDIKRPEAGGKIEAVINAPPLPGVEFDGVATNTAGNVLIQEGDIAVGPFPNGTAQVHQWDAGNQDLIPVAQTDAIRFELGFVDLYPDFQYPQFPGPQIALFAEATGMIDISSILGSGYYLAAIQANADLRPFDPEVVEGGQLVVINTNAATTPFIAPGGVLTVEGTINADQIRVTRGVTPNTLTVTVNGGLPRTFNAPSVLSIRVTGHAGDDVITIDRPIALPAILDGGLGKDRITGGIGRAVIIGGAGADVLAGLSGSDLMISGTYTGTPAQLTVLFNAWAVAPFNPVINRVIAANNLMFVPVQLVFRDFAKDTMTTVGGNNFFIFTPGEDLALGGGFSSFVF